MNFRERFDACREKEDFCNLCIDLLAELDARKRNFSGTTFAECADKISELERRISKAISDYEYWHKEWLNSR